MYESCRSGAKHMREPKKLEQVAAGPMWLQGEPVARLYGVLTATTPIFDSSLVHELLGISP